jgi:hypothetical protein
VLGHGLGHLTCHAKGRSRRSRHDARGVSRVWTTIGLGEFERGQVLGGFVAVGELDMNYEYMRITYVVNEWGKLLKNCLWVTRSSDTIRVAKRSSVSWNGEEGGQPSVRSGQGMGRTLRNGLPRFVTFIM